MGCLKPSVHIVFQADLSWLDAKDDALFDEIGRIGIRQINEYARQINQANEFIYLDYASQKQNPLGSYGSNNLRKLRGGVARKYDPLRSLPDPGAWRLQTGRGRSSMSF
jgi:hypothetical protein